MKNYSLKLSALLCAFVMMLSVPSFASSPMLGNISEFSRVSINFHQPADKIIGSGYSMTAELNVPETGNTALSVHNEAGKEVWTGNIDLEAGTNMVRFKVGELEKGVYFLKISNGVQNDTQSFVVN